MNSQISQIQCILLRNVGLSESTSSQDVNKTKQSVDATREHFFLALEETLQRPIYKKLVQSRYIYILKLI